MPPPSQKEVSVFYFDLLVLGASGMLKILVDIKINLKKPNNILKTLQLYKIGFVRIMLF